MKRFYRDFRLSVIIAVVAFSSCWVICNILSHHDHIHDPHQWLHDKLNLTSEQDQKLIPIEEKFISKKNNLELKINEANRELAAVIKKANSYSEEVQSTVDKIHRAQGELQKATLEHLFDMHSVLSPEQREKLNSLTTEALTHTP